jgi:hypothetical protein
MAPARKSQTVEPQCTRLHNGHPPPLKQVLLPQWGNPL